MDPLILLFLVFIVLVSGGIGILADTVGRKLGKKRLSIFNLRPKHTAWLGTFLAGMVTSSITILLVFILSRDVRDWIVEGRAAIRKAEHLKEQNDSLQSQASEMQSSVKDLDSQRRDLTNRLASGNAQLHKLEGSLNEAAKRYEAAMKREAGVQARLNGVSSKLQAATDRLAATNENLSRVQTKLAGVQMSFKTLNTQIKDQYDEDRRLREQKAQLTDENKKLSATLDGLRTDATSLKTEVDQYKQAQEQAKSDLANAKSELEGARNELTKVNGQVEVEKTALSRLQQISNASRTQPLIFAQGEELARTQVPARAGRRVIEAAIQRLLRMAREAATKRGAVPLKTRGESAGLVTIFNEETRLDVTAEEQQDAIIQRLENEPNQVVIIAQSLLNSFRGEFVAVVVHGYNDPVVYHRRQTVASIRINGRQPINRLLSQVQDFVSSGIVKNALSAGMIPVEGASTFVDVPELTILSVVEQIATAGRSVRVEAVASRETRASDKLQVEFVVK